MYFVVNILEPRHIEHNQHRKFLVVVSLVPSICMNHIWKKNLSENLGTLDPFMNKFFLLYISSFELSSFYWTLLYFIFLELLSVVYMNFQRHSHLCPSLSMGFLFLWWILYLFYSNFLVLVPFLIIWFILDCYCLVFVRSLRF